MEIKISKSAMVIAVATALSSGAVWADSGVHRLSGSAAFASVEDVQSSTGNLVDNNDLENTANTGQNVMKSATGNIGLNIAAGDNNLQDNATVISVAAPGGDGGIVDSDVFVEQTASGNATSNDGVMNGSTIGGGSFASASGNIGANMASGDNNLQKNNTAISVGDGTLAVASVSAAQVVSGNKSRYEACAHDTNSAVLNGAAFEGAGGNIGVNMASGSNNLQSNSMAIAISFPSVN